MAANVIFHIDELNKWDLLFENVRNLIKAYEPDSVDIEVVANSVAVQFYKKDNDTSRINELVRSGVVFCACNNALRKLGLKEEDIIKDVRIVPAGVKEIVEKEIEGYAYIKP